MTFEKLKESGIKVHEDDFYEGDIYLFTVSYWVYNGALYRHDEHPNQIKYTGKTETVRCTNSETEFYLREFSEKDAKKCIDLLNEYRKNNVDPGSIKEHRKAAGLTQEQFSELFDIPLNTIKKWDAGISSPPDWAAKLIINELKRRTD